MNWLFHIVFSFIASTAFGIIFNAPKKMIVYSGLVGMSGWLVYFVIQSYGVSIVQASFAGAFIVAIIAHLLAKKHRMPMIIFSVAGIIPLVPGGSAYNAMRNVIENDFNEAILFATKAFMISGAIAMGLVFAEVMIQAIFRIRKHQK